jgi:amino acid transporter
MVGSRLAILLCLYRLQLADQYSIHRAAEEKFGPDLEIPPGQACNAYDRKGKRYPYRSWGQPLKAYVGFGGCSLLVMFNGWRSFVTPFSVPDFIASYISVRPFYSPPATWTS